MLCPAAACYDVLPLPAVLPPQTVANILWGFSSLGCASKELLGAAASEIARRCGAAMGLVHPSLCFEGGRATWLKNAAAHPRHTSPTHPHPMPRHTTPRHAPPPPTTATQRAGTVRRACPRTPALLCFAPLCRQREGGSGGRSGPGDLSCFLDQEISNMLLAYGRAEVGWGGAGWGGLGGGILLDQEISKLLLAYAVPRWVRAEYLLGKDFVDQALVAHIWDIQ